MLIISESVLERIGSNYKSLSRAQRRIADYILENSDRACFLSLKELSQQVDTTEVTVLKFTRYIGYESFSELKKELQAYISLKLSPSEKIATAIKKLGETAETSEPFRQIIANDREVIEQTMKYLSFDDLRRTIAALKNANKIYLVGDNISLVVVDFLRIRLRNLGLDAGKLDLSSIDTVASQLVRVKRGDVFVVVSFPKYAERVVTLTEYLNVHGIEMICITDRMTSPVARYASVTFPCATDSPVFYNSISGVIVLANAIVSSLALELKEGFNENRDRIDEVASFFRGAGKK